MSIAEKIIAMREEKRPIVNDFSVLHSSVDYDKDGYLKYILFDVMADSGTQQDHFFKAIKLYRLIRVPNNDKIANFLMEKQSEVLASLWGNQINFLAIVANILQPKPIGLVYTYGVQGIGQTLEEAKHNADKAFSALTASLKGVFRTIEFRNYNYDEAEWLRKKMVSMKNLAILRGVPYPHQSTGTPANVKGGGSAKSDIRSQTETMEEFIAGMGDHEYVMVTMATPIRPMVLQKWLTLVSREESKWASIMQGASSVNFSMSLPMMFGGNLGATAGHNAGISHTAGVAHGHVASWSDGTSHGVTNGVSHSIGTGTSHSVGQTLGHTHTVGHSTGTSTGTTTTTTHGTTATTGHTQGTTNQHSSTSGDTKSHGTSNGTSQTSSTAEGSSSGWSASSSNSSSSSNSHSWNEGNNISSPKLLGAGYSRNWGNGWSDGTANATSTGGGESGSTSQTTTVANGNTSGSTTTSGVTSSLGQSWGASAATTHSTATSSSQSVGHSQSQTNTNSVSDATSASTSTTNGTSSNVSNGTTSSTSNTVTSSRGGSDSVTNSVSNGTTSGVSSGWNLGTSSTMGMAPGISVGKSYQWKDSEVENVVRVIDFVKERLMKSLNGQGAFYVDVMIGTENESAHDAVRSISKAAFYYKEALANPLEVIEPKDRRKQHMLYHFGAFSPCLEKDAYDGNYDAYKYSTVLLPDELTAYTHPPRMSDGGLYADVEDMPQLSVPSDRQNGDVYMGHILSGQRWSEEEFRRSGNGYKTPFKYSIYSAEIMHTIFQGESRSGKTVAAIRFIAGLANVVRPTGKRMRIVVFDQKDDWRKLQKLVDADRFRFYKIDSTDELGLKVNLCKIAPNVHPETHIKTLAEIFVSAYGLGILGSQIMKDGLFELYMQNGCIGENWREDASKNSAKVTLSDLYELINKQFIDAGRQNGNNMKDAYQRVLVRLKDYATEGMNLHEIFSTPEGIAIHELMGKDDIIVIEGNNLDRIEKNFIYGMMFATIYSWGVNNGTFLAEDNYETFCVVEEANSVLIGQGGADGTGGDNLPGQSRFESIVDMAAGLGFFIAAITQKIQDMPPSIVNSCGLWFIGRTKATKAHEIILPAFGKNPRYEYQYSKWLSRSPDLWFMCMAGRTRDFKTSAPVHVMIDMIPASKPTDMELLKHRKLQDVAKKQQQFLARSEDTVPWLSQG